MGIGRKIFFDKVTGNALVDTGERAGSVVATTVEQDFASYNALAERVPETVGVLELEYGQFAQDFAECNGFRIDPETGQILFSYPDPEEPEAPPVYQKPLSVTVSEQEQRLSDIELALAEIFSGGV